MSYIMVDIIGEMSTHRLHTHGLCTGGCHWGGEYSQVIYWWMSLGR